MLSRTILVILYLFNEKCYSKDILDDTEFMDTDCCNLIPSPIPCPKSSLIPSHIPSPLRLLLYIHLFHLQPLLIFMNYTIIFIYIVLFPLHLVLKKINMIF